MNRILIFAILIIVIVCSQGALLAQLTESMTSSQPSVEQSTQRMQEAREYFEMRYGQSVWKSKLPTQLGGSQAEVEKLGWQDLDEEIQAKEVQNAGQMRFSYKLLPSGKSEASQAANLRVLVQGVDSTSRSRSTRLLEHRPLSSFTNTPAVKFGNGTDGVELLSYEDLSSAKQDGGTAGSLWAFFPLLIIPVLSLFGWNLFGGKSNSKNKSEFCDARLDQFSEWSELDRALSVDEFTASSFDKTEVSQTMEIVAESTALNSGATTPDLEKKSIARCTTEEAPEGSSLQSAEQSIEPALFVPEDRSIGETDADCCSIEPLAEMKTSRVDDLSDLEGNRKTVSNSFPKVRPMTNTTKAMGKTLQQDDLTRILGIGPATQHVLRKLGVRRFEQIAKMDAKQLDDLFSNLQSRFQLLDTSTWPTQAKEIVSQRESSLDRETELLDEINAICGIATLKKSSPARLNPVELNS